MQLFTVRITRGRRGKGNVGAKLPQSSIPTGFSIGRFVADSDTNGWETNVREYTQRDSDSARGGIEHSFQTICPFPRRMLPFASGSRSSVRWLPLQIEARQQRNQAGIFIDNRELWCSARVYSESGPLSFEKQYKRLGLDGDVAPLLGSGSGLGQAREKGKSKETDRQKAGRSESCSDYLIKWRNFRRLLRSYCRNQGLAFSSRLNRRALLKRRVGTLRQGDRSPEVSSLPTSFSTVVAVSASNRRDESFLPVTRGTWPKDACELQAFGSLGRDGGEKRRGLMNEQASLLVT
ncbi:hypothetical protein K0M31_003915 [Melipona bicolor]|uniref:Uncharacterized protein n=1 Tax=Melipona bicolor TaxID=60889 RepID=A0AA40FXS7_9HYME|nr:hypothetical protein K0M31_003915 [Melipona bicolor]